MTNGIKDNPADHAAKQHDPEISIVIPFQDEQETLAALQTQIKDVLAGVGRSFETSCIWSSTTSNNNRWIII